MDLSNYLKKFSDSVPLETKVRNAVVAAVLEVVGIELQRNNIRVVKDTVYITAPAAVRSEIAMKQEKILKKIYEENNELKIKKIL